MVVANPDPKVHSICLVKDEIDIIEHCLDQASQWSDYIYVFDNGSSDGTWEQVQKMQNSTIVAWKREDKTFQDHLRANVFQAFKDRATTGDWWCRLDSDEFYTIQDPKEFLAQVDPYHYTVMGVGLEYSLSHQDVDEIDFSQPVEELLPELRHYQAFWYEPRFVRHRNGMRWTHDWPRHMGLVHPTPILYRHYRYRTPEQMQKRLDARLEAFNRGLLPQSARHEYDGGWKKKLVNPEDMCLDTGSGPYATDISIELEPIYKRWARSLLHRSGLWV